MILVDAGPLAALAHADDQHHAECRSALAEVREPLATVWPVLSETMYLLGRLPQSQDVIWEMFTRGFVRILPLDFPDIVRIRGLMRKYADRRMDLADAALIAVAERENIRTIFTVDKKDFAVYRLHGRVRPNIFP
ncbi:MAG: type II toxin-antitoxin system VapC family toxin [Candidatus Acidiferrales bacterium]